MQQQDRYPLYSIGHVAKRVRGHVAGRVGTGSARLSGSWTWAAPGQPFSMHRRCSGVDYTITEWPRGSGIASLSLDVLLKLLHLCLVWRLRVLL